MMKRLECFMSHIGKPSKFIFFSKKKLMKQFNKTKLHNEITVSMAYKDIGKSNLIFIEISCYIHTLSFFKYDVKWIFFSRYFEKKLKRSSFHQGNITSKKFKIQKKSRLFRWIWFISLLSLSCSKYLTSLKWFKIVQHPFFTFWIS